MVRAIKWFLVGVSAALLLTVGGSARAAPGDLDPTFGTNGITSTTVGGGVRAFALVRLSDGGLVVAGVTLGAGDPGDALLARYTEAGSLDPSFGGTGIVRADFGGTDYAFAVVAQPDDKLVVAVSSYQNASSRFYLARYLPNGTLDPSFGGNGVVTVPIDGLAGLPYGLALQPDGKILAAGPRGTTGVDLARYTPTGALDTSFGSNGTVTTPLSPNGTPMWYGVVVQPDGKVVVKANTGIGVELARYRGDGTLDETFGESGHVALMRPFSATSLVLQPDGKLALGGLWSCGVVCDFGLVRLTPSGALDSSFGANGIVTTDLGAQEAPYALVLQPDGKLVLAGGTGAAFPSNRNFAVVRYDVSGTPDGSFGTNGVVVTDAGGDDTAFGLVLQPDGKLVAAGDGLGNAPYPPTSLVLVRYLGDALGFASLEAQAIVLLPRGTANDTAWLTASVRLDPRSDGIDPRAEAVRIDIGSLSLTLPPGSFTKGMLGWTYRGRVDGVLWTVSIARLFEGRYVLTAVATRLDLEPPPPVDVHVTIGNDTGSTAVHPLVLPRG